MENKPSKKLASVKNPTIEGAIHRLLKLGSEEDAAKKLEVIKKNFVISKDQPYPTAVKLWVEDYEVTEAEKKAGYSGNFAAIGYVKEEDKYVFGIQKLEVELKSHPQKIRPKMKHPNWAHPVLSSIRKKKKYKTEADANAQLMRLSEEYPEVAIPALNKLYIMVYEKPEGGSKPVKKYRLEIVAHDDGQFAITAKDNEKKPAKPAPKKPDAVQPPAEILGKFTQLVIERKKRKKKK